MRSRNRWRRSNGCASRAEQILFKYCSTFDSTDAGNIGPVADALLESLGDSFTVACAAFPTNKRTVYLGHLFVGEQLLSDSPMKDHPLTPMRDSMREAFEQLKASGHAYAIVDAVADEDLLALGAAFAELP
jgi:3-dehydrotetronate 4-kinase